MDIFLFFNKRLLLIEKDYLNLNKKIIVYIKIKKECFKWNRFQVLNNFYGF